MVELLAVMGLQGTVLALLAFAVVRAGALRPGWQAAVWLVVLAKFALPWGPALPWSLADLFAAFGSHHEGGAIHVAPAAGPIAVHAASPGWLVLAVVWLGGAAVVLARALIAQHRVTRTARLAPEAPVHARALLSGLCRRPPRLVVGAPSIGPHVVGLVRPIIVIPPALLDDPSLLAAALLHELAHVRRWDALARIVQLVACALFFFWPVVRMASRRLDLSREAACDAWALEASALPRPAYARLLVRMAQLRAVGSSLAAPFGLDARVAAVLGPVARNRLGMGHRLALLAWIAVALGGARTASARGEHATCKYTPQLAEALRQAHPEADRDGDGVLSRDEACEFQAELRKKLVPLVGAPTGAELVSRVDQLDENLLTEPLCCNCDRGAENSAPWIASHGSAGARSTPGESIEKRSNACQSDDEGMKESIR
ncbi:MAG TPA: M56 family metallopeptidase [Kofleriaceae bacterium]|nr:M56 family metallopeptidase [Kofleriaceae bacterium]